MDKFEGKLYPHIYQETWGHGETGWTLSLFSSHDEQEVIKARNHLFYIIGCYEQSKSWEEKLG